MSNILKWSLKKAIIAFGAVFSVFAVVSAFLAPVLANAKLTPISDFLYDFLHKICNEYNANHFFIFGNPLGLCPRCVGAYMTAAITLYFGFNKTKINKVIFIIFGMLSIVEIILEKYSFIPHNDFISLVSGLCLGVFVGTGILKILDWLEGKKGW